jgi:hypothetical protein
MLLIDLDESVRGTAEETAAVVIGASPGGLLATRAPPQLDTSAPGVSDPR